MAISNDFNIKLFLPSDYALFHSCLLFLFYVVSYKPCALGSPCFKTSMSELITGQRNWLSVRMQTHYE